MRHARDQKRLKRGGNFVQISMSDAAEQPQELSVDLVDLDAALNKLESFDPRKSLVVELKFFGGLSVEETAEVLKVAPITVIRDWNLARAWLAREMGYGS